VVVLRSDAAPLPRSSERSPEPEPPLADAVVEPEPVAEPAELPADRLCRRKKVAA
jgi:hypothetical protein